jgi:hypothetical protein
MFVFHPAYAAWITANIMLGYYTELMRKHSPYPRSLCG